MNAREPRMLTVPLSIISDEVLPTLYRTLVQFSADSRAEGLHRYGDEADTAVEQLRGEIERRCGNAADYAKLTG